MHAIDRTRHSIPYSQVVHALYTTFSSLFSKLSSLEPGHASVRLLRTCPPVRSRICTRPRRVQCRLLAPVPPSCL
eukprot:4204148-Prymnesium_polylepis.1